MTYVWRVADEWERRLKLVEKQGGRRNSMVLPPAIDDADLIARLRIAKNLTAEKSDCAMCPL